VTASDQASLEAGNAAFAFDLYGALRQPGRNLFFSPYSITSALAMTYAGAQGATAGEMARTMRLSLPAERVHPAFDWLDLQLASRASPIAGNQGKPFTLRVANAVWGERTESWHQGYLDTLAVDYGAGIRLVDFGADPGAAESAMDAWVAEQTGGRITQLVPPSSIDASTRLVVANAVLFEASWASPFRPNRTAPATFTRADGSTEDIPTMHQNTKLPYAQDADGWQTVELPYVGEQVAMDVVLPPAGADVTFDAALGADRFAAIVASLTPEQVDLALPKLSIPGATLGLTAALEHLGMTSAFAPGADFGGMCDDPLWLRDVFHQATLTVDENGTSAAAATVGIGPTDLQKPVTMSVDHPFFLAIRDRATGTILFAGKIDAP
jgi:serpin B